MPGSSASFADGSPPLQGYSERLDSGNFSTRRQGKLQKNCKSIRGHNQGSTLVDSRPCTSKWQGDYSSKSGFSNFRRCFKDRTESSSSRNPHTNLYYNLYDLEALNHINYLELKATFLALRAFLPLIKGSHVRFGLDNCTAVAYISRLEGTKSQHLTALAVDIWCYAPDRNMVISAIHVPGKWNRIADGKSRIFHDSIEWMLDHNLFKQITRHLGLPVVNLFASQVNHQIPEFVAWRPEPGAIAMDAFNIRWDFPLSYLFPPIFLIPMCLRKVMQEQVDCILIAPVWRSQPWYPALLSMLIERPLLLPQGRSILKLQGTDKIHPLCCQKKFQLTAWKISGKACKTKAFWKKCQKSIVLLEKQHSQAI